MQRGPTRAKRRGDILAFIDNQTHWLDVTVSHPCVPHNVPSDGPIRPRYTAEKAARRKIQSFATIVNTDPAVQFLPLSFEAYGSFDSRVHTFIDSAAIRAERAGFNRTSAKLLFTRALAVSVQAGTARLFMNYQHRLIAQGQPQISFWGPVRDRQ